MDLKILSYRKAIKYEPIEKTYAIRIFSNNHKNRLKLDLVQSSNYIRKVQYYLDDLVSEKEAESVVNQGLVLTMLNDFYEWKDKCDCLLIHCIYGLSRSTAIGIAFNNIFKLGNDTKSLMELHQKYNRHIYDMFVNTAKKYKYL